MASFLFKTQRSNVVVSLFIYNIIRENSTIDQDFNLIYKKDEDYINDDEDIQITNNVTNL